METPNWTVFYKINSRETDDPPQWAGTGWEFFNTEEAATQCYIWRIASGDEPVKRPYHSADAVHLATH